MKGTQVGVRVYACIVHALIFFPCGWVCVKFRAPKPHGNSGISNEAAPVVQPPLHEDANVVGTTGIWVPSISAPIQVRRCLCSSTYALCRRPVSSLVARSVEFCAVKPHGNSPDEAAPGVQPPDGEDANVGTSGF